MGRQTVDVEINSFVKGLITEAGPLNFPENASIEEKNFVLNRDGSRQRRLGMEYEDSYSLKDTVQDLVTTDIAVSSHIWENPSQDGSINIGVIQVGTSLYFTDITAETLSTSFLNGGVAIDTGGDSTTKISATSIRGKLVVAHGLPKSLLFKYEAGTVVAPTDIFLEMRDQFGIDEGVAVDLRPTWSVGSEGYHIHRYNLLNQGWPLDSEHISNFNGDNHTQADPVVTTNSVLGVSPSNADIYWANAMDSAKDAQLIGMFNPYMLERGFTGSAQAPRGRVILDIFSRGASRQAAYGAGGTYILQDKTSGAITSVASYAGRVFYTTAETDVAYGDGNSPNVGSLVFYSQVVSSDSDLGKCHSELDPTAETLNDILDSDGGFVSLPDAGTIFGLAPLGNSLFVIADNGVWELHGGEGIFSATNQNISKTSKIGALSPSSVLSSEEILSYWSESGIQIVTKDDVSLRGKAENITYQTIQSFYEGISTEAKKNLSAVFDPVSRQVRWLYGESLDNKSFANKELVFDLSLGAFYTSEISNLAANTPYLAGYLPLPSTIFNTTAQEIVVEGLSYDVVVGTDNVVASARTIDESVKGSTKYLTLVKNSGDSNWSFTFSHYRQADFKDWVTADGVGLDAPCSLLTGFLTAGVPSRDKKTPYLVTHCRLTEEGFTDDGLGNLTPVGESSCLVQSQWEWTNSAAAGRWGTQFQAYRLPRYFGPTDATDPFDYGFTVVTTKSKLRGKGRALSLLFQTEAGKDLHLYGWGHTLNIEGKS